MRRRFVGGRTVIVLGKRAAAAFGLRGVGYFEREIVGSAIVVVVPHPSGVNRWYNGAGNRRQMAHFMRRIVSEGVADE